MIAEVSTQLSEVVSVIERHLRTTLLPRTFAGSAVDGGLKPHSDIDLLVTVTGLDETTRRALINDLWKLRFPERARFSGTVVSNIVVHDDIIPWRYPAARTQRSLSGLATTTVDNTQKTPQYPCQQHDADCRQHRQQNRMVCQRIPALSLNHGRWPT